MDTLEDSIKKIVRKGVTFSETNESNDNNDNNTIALKALVDRMEALETAIEVHNFSNYFCL
jgi:hypothetical protein